MVNNPIKIQDNFYLYSGDVITIDSNDNISDSLLIEIVKDEKAKVKLRNIEDDNYLSQDNKGSIKKFFSLEKKLKFLTDFKDALVFTINKKNNGRVSLQTIDNKYLDYSNNKKFHLSLEEKWLTINKQQNTEEIFNCHEEIIKALILATTSENDLIIDPCAGSFVVLGVCQELNRNYLGVDLTFREMTNFLENNKK